MSYYSVNNLKKSYGKNLILKDISFSMNEGEVLSLNSIFSMKNNNLGFLELLDVMGGGALSNVSIFALGVSPYITAQIIVQLLSTDVLPALSELKRQGQYGRKKMEMATRYLTLMLGAVQAYGIIKTISVKD